MKKKLSILYGMSLMMVLCMSISCVYAEVEAPTRSMADIICPACSWIACAIMVIGTIRFHFKLKAIKKKYEEAETKDDEQKKAELGKAATNYVKICLISFALLVVYLIFYNR